MMYLSCKYEDQTLMPRIHMHIPAVEAYVTNPCDGSMVTDKSLDVAGHLA